jgi:hypothetical protein
VASRSPRRANSASLAGAKARQSTRAGNDCDGCGGQRTPICAARENLHYGSGCCEVNGWWRFPPNSGRISRAHRLAGWQPLRKIYAQSSVGRRVGISSERREIFQEKQLSKCHIDSDNRTIGQSQDAPSPHAHRASRAFSCRRFQGQPWPAPSCRCNAAASYSAMRRLVAEPSHGPPTISSVGACVPAH